MILEDSLSGQPASFLWFGGYSATCKTVVVSLVFLVALVFTTRLADFGYYVFTGMNGGVGME